ncbi:DUF4267 domain-containing protein [Pseudoxanthomonas sp. UTMC 1351]|uniref:DUF4267 domain-containing protein n=1 Tax=Pseudoxanthomonas sp. UTMC 1351 TaxID=2695853 RepID=UPI0034CEB7AD
MGTNESKALRTTGMIFVLLMAGLQLAYALYAFADPAGFSLLRGTELFAAGDSDWIRIYASRTLFIALIIGYLLYRKHFKILAVASLLGIVMPVTDAWLAYQASAGDKVILKHVVTALFLIITFAILRSVVRRGQSA